MSEGWKMNFKNLCQFPGCADMSQHGHPQTEWGNAVHSLRSDNASLRARVAQKDEAFAEARRGLGALASVAADLEDSPISLSRWVLDHLPEINATLRKMDAALPSAGKENP